MPPLKDLTGMVFDRLTVLERAENDKRGRVRWLCRCECGNKKIILSKSLIAGDTHSCGCLCSEIALDNLKKARVRHGKYKTRLYRIWAGALQRCSNPNEKAYPNYGGRGITVCEEWRQFEPFYKWAIANGYRADLSLDRIDVDGNYEPGNVRFVDEKTQQNNRRNNHRLAFEGKIKTLTQWSEETGIASPTIRKRLDYGWTIEKTLTTPTLDRSRNLTFKGTTRSVTEWAKELHINKNTLLFRLSHNWSVEEALTTPVKKYKRSDK